MTAEAGFDDVLAPAERARYLRPAALPGVELLSARFVTHRYLPHAHEKLTLALIGRGAERFAHRGAQEVAAAGDIAVIAPGELHTGEAAREDGWAYRVLYVAPQWLEVAAFRQPVFRDDVLAALLRGAHEALLTPGASALAQEVWLRRALERLTAAHGEVRAPVVSTPAPDAVRAAREVLDACPEADLSLSALAARVGLSPAHLARAFRAAVGAAPHTYQMTARARRARELLDRGEPPAGAAQAAGFADQAHLSRVFKRVYGVPPGAYARAGRSGSGT